MIEFKPHQVYYHELIKQEYLPYRTINRFSMILGDPPGAGKTLTSLGAVPLFDRQRVIIICPIAARLNWAREILRLDPNASISNIESKWKIEKQIEELEKKSKYTIISFSQTIKMDRYVKETQLDGTLKTKNRDVEKTLDRLYPYLESVKWDSIIIDEAHTLRNRKTKLFGFVRSICNRRTGDLQLLTGTLLYTHPEDMFALCQLINRQKYSSYWAWARKYCILEDNPYSPSPIVKGFKDPAEVQADISPFYIERPKSVLNLPPIKFNWIPVELGTEQRDFYNSIRVQKQKYKTKGAFIYNGNVCAIKNGLARLFYLKKAALSLDLLDDESSSVEGSKIDALNKLLDSLVPDKVVIFSQQVEALERLYNLCNNACIAAGRQPRAVLYRGGIASDKRDRELERFKTDPYVDRLYISTPAGGESLNITEAHHLVALELTESPAKNDQFISRVWRYGQTETTQIYILYAKDTVEERVIQVATDRKELFSQSIPITEDISKILREEKGN